MYRNTIREEHRRATQFFWGWLVASTAASIVGNVAHAVLSAHGGHAAVAATASVVPPAVLLGATHGVAQLVRVRITGPMYRAAFVLLVLLGACAFTLSFGALCDLATRWAELPRTTAWLWPLAIDLSITQSTIALLALTTGKRVKVAEPQQRRKAPVRKKAKPTLVRSAAVA